MTEIEITLTGRIFPQIHMFRSIDLCVLRDACHEFIRAFWDVYASGPQVAEVTKSLLTVKLLCIKYRGN